MSTSVFTCSGLSNTRLCRALAAASLSCVALGLSSMFSTWASACRPPSFAISARKSSCSARLCSIWMAASRQLDDVLFTSAMRTGTSAVRPLRALSSAARGRSALAAAVRTSSLSSPSRNASFSMAPEMYTAVACSTAIWPSACALSLRVCASPASSSAASTGMTSAAAISSQPSLSLASRRSTLMASSRSCEDFAPGCTAASRCW
mmetsp:Transcript_18614/g.48644  ORF Transcript_18614/g.48644 Transcript_18614/m.48644 type:complete len:206 (-) Transcript_18614:203-820(-)